MNNCPQSNHETSSKLSAIKIDDVSSKRTFQLNGSKVTELSSMTSRVDIGRPLLSCQQQQQQQKQAELPTGIIVTSHLTVETS
jgi:phosphotransferase system IIA component